MSESTGESGVTDCTVFGGSLVEQVVAVPHLPQRGQANVPMNNMVTLPGGSGGNVAVYMARLGFSVELVDLWGVDQHADLLAEHLREENVGLEHVRRLPKMPTPFMIILTLPDGDWSGITRLPEQADVGPGDFDPEVVSRSRFLHLHSFNLTNQRGKDGAARAVEVASRSGVSISLDACTPVAASDSDAILALVPYCEVFFANLQEAEMLTGNKDVEGAARKLQDLGALNVVIKAGSSGCYALGPGQLAPAHIPAVSVVVSDTIGAGDGVVAGTLAGLIRGLELVDSVGIGVAVAGLVCEGQGAQSRRFAGGDVYGKRSLSSGETGGATTR